jgi:hypothetical protein
VVSLADQRAATTNKQLDLWASLHVEKMQTPAAHRAWQPESVDTAGRQESVVDDGESPRN